MSGEYEYHLIYIENRSCSYSSSTKLLHLILLRADKYIKNRELRIIKTSNAICIAKYGKFKKKRMLIYVLEVWVLLKKKHCSYSVYQLYLINMTFMKEFVKTAQN